MSKRYRTGIIGFGHMHINNVAAMYARHPQVVWTACADTVPASPERRAAPYTREWNLKYAQTEWGIPKVYDDYREMLACCSLDIVIVTSENSQHAPIVEACAEKGVHVCVEKPMADSLSNALRMVRACQAHPIMMVVNWPLTWSPQARTMKRLIDAGAIGTCGTVSGDSFRQTQLSIPIKVTFQPCCSRMGQTA